MRDEDDPRDQRLARIEAGVDRLNAAVAALADRVEIIQQEFQRSATQLHRLGLNQETAKLGAQRHDKSLQAVSAELAAIKTALRQDAGE